MHLLAFLMAILVICLIGLVCLIHLLCVMFESDLEAPDAMGDGSLTGECTVGSMANREFDAGRHHQ